jgi:uncharacterized protein involved in type VI secretion and phage assembly
MPLMMPEAGGPQNRGYIFVPEKNDKVLVSFFEGNPEFPFIMGSMFHGKNGKGIGGGAGNHTKSMRDKSGSEVVLNDKDGSVTIKDKAGDFVKLDGTDYIEVTANDHIKLTNGKCIIEMIGNKIGITAIDEFKVTVGSSILTMTENEVKLETSSKIDISSDNQILVQAQSNDVTIQGSGDAIIIADKGEIHLI